MTVKVKRGEIMSRFLSRIALTRIAKAIVFASEKGAGAGDAILYQLPGVFSMRITYRGESVRLIKEANTFRIMEKSEKSEESLSIIFADRAALADLACRHSTLQKVYSEGRVTFGGKIKYATLIMRVTSYGDKVRLSDKKYRELYGE